jgi:AbrB family looped-hinge helix DNA binding protein
MPSAMVTFNGRITLPSHVRKQLGLKTGDSVDFVEIEKGRFAITPGADAVTDSAATSNSDPKGWFSSLDFSLAAEQTPFNELDEVLR